MDEDVDVEARPKPRDPNDLSEYKLDEYDEESPSAAAGAFTNIGRLTYYHEGEEDPYVTLKEVRFYEQSLLTTHRLEGRGRRRKGGAGGIAFG